MGASLGEGDSIRGLASLSPRAAGATVWERPGPKMVVDWGQGLACSAAQGAERGYKTVIQSSCVSGKDLVPNLNC